MSRDPFKIFEYCDLSISSTPKTSRQIQRKLFPCFTEDKEPQSTWSEVIVNEQLSSISTQNLITPPSVKLMTTQPPAPTKSRKYIKRVDLKPKKLIFNNLEEPESDAVYLPKVFRIHSEDNFSGNILGSRNDAKDDGRLKGRGKIIDDDNKENYVASVRMKSKSNSIKTSSISSMPQQKNAHLKSGIKHFRV